MWAVFLSDGVNYITYLAVVYSFVDNLYYDWSKII